MGGRRKNLNGASREEDGAHRRRRRRGWQDRTRDFSRFPSPTFVRSRFGARTSPCTTTITHLHPAALTAEEEDQHPRALLAGEPAPPHHPRPPPRHLESTAGTRRDGILAATFISIRAARNGLLW